MKASSKKLWVVSLMLLAFLVLAIQPTLAASSIRISVGANEVQGNSYSAYSDISGDGRYVAFVSWADNLVSGDTNHYADVFVRDTQNGFTTRASVDSNGEQANNTVETYKPTISADGRYVAFASRASNLILGDTNGTTDVFVRDILGGTTIRVSVDSHGLQGNGASTAGFISADGRYVAFESYANNLVDGDTNFVKDIFVHDTLNGTTTRASVSSSGVPGNGDSFNSDISSDGRYVVFTSNSTQLVSGDTNFVEDIFLHDNVNGTTTRLSVSTGGTQSNNISQRPVISANGRFAAFYSYASNLVSGDTNGASDIFVRDTQNGTTTRVSVGAGAAQANSNSYFPAISADGRYVGFYSNATNLVSNDTNNARDIFVRDTQSGTTARVSVDSSGTQANSNSMDPTISADGRYVTFTSDATNLIRNDTNGVSDVYINDNSLVTVEASPSSWDFGSQPIGTPSVAHTFTIQNNSPTDVVIGTLGVVGDFSISSNNCDGQTLVPEGTCSIEVTFIPTDLGARSGYVSIAIDDRAWPEIVGLSGNGLNSPPSIDILSVVPDGPYQISTMDLSDPEGDPLSGSVKILLHTTLPTTVTFETLSCNGNEPSELWLNGNLVGTNPAPGSCSCPQSVITSSVFSGTALTNSYLPGENNTWTFNQPDLLYQTATAWARTAIHFSDGSIQTACLFDSTGTGCTTTNMCIGYALGPVSDSAVQPVAEQVFVSQPYDNSTLPAYLDTSSLTPGYYTLLANAHDGFNFPVSDTQEFLLTNETRLYINPTNTAPVLDPIGDRSVNELTTLVFTATASDLDLPANTLTFALDAGAPAGTAIDPVTGVFSWMPGEAYGFGNYPVTVRVTDDGIPSLDDSETFTITVNEINIAPVLDPIGDRSVNELTTLVFTATASDADLPANALTFALDAGAPAGTAIDPVTGVFSWMPGEAYGSGNYPVTVRVTDDGIPSLVDSETFTITVNEVNIAPVLGSISDRSVNELTTLIFTATASDADLPANTITFALDAGAPAGTAIDPITGVFSWMPGEAYGFGNYPVTVRVTDDGIPSLDDSETFTITVNEVNIAPVLDPIGNRSVNELITLIFTATANDPDLPANTLTFALDAGAPAGTAIDPVTGLFTWTPTEAQGPGVYTLTIRVVDDGMPILDDFETFQVTVSEVNQAPVANAGDDQNVIDGAIVRLNGSTSYDPDYQPLAFRWVQTGGSPQMSLSDPSAVKPTFTASTMGVYTFTLTVTDTYMVTDSDKVVISVISVPEADLAVTLNRSGLTTVTYTVVVTNLGPDAADGATVHDELSNAFTNVTWICTASNGAVCTHASGSGNLLDETIAQLPNGGTVIFTIVGNISLFADDSNQVIVTAPSVVDDANLSNNGASLTRSYRYVLPFVLYEISN